MNENQTKTFHRLLAGIQFLANEAERNGLESVAHILRICARNVKDAPQEETARYGSQPHFERKENAHDEQ